MATIKICTDIPQSKVLAGFLPIKSADMFYALEGTVAVASPYIEENLIPGDPTAIPCWSLAALLGVLKNYTLQTNTDGTVFVVREGKKPIISDFFNNPIDACVAMIEKLHELKIL